MIRVSQLKLPVEHSEEQFYQKIEKSLKIIDTSDLLIYILNNNEEITEEEKEILEKTKNKKTNKNQNQKKKNNITKPTKKLKIIIIKALWKVILCQVE